MLGTRRLLGGFGCLLLFVVVSALVFRPPFSAAAEEDAAATDATSSDADGGYTPHSVEGPRAQCLRCHRVGAGPKPLPSDHAAWTVDTCLPCHPTAPAAPTPP